MKRFGTRLAAVAVLVAGLMCAAMPPAAAHDEDGNHFFFGLHLGSPPYYHPWHHRWWHHDWDHPGWHWRYYHPPPYYYPRPPPVVYVPVPQAQAPTCRVFHGNATVDATGRPFYGTACFESDNRWHIVS